MGHDELMTPDEAYRFYEEDEDPRRIFAKFDAGPKSVTSAPSYAKRAPAGTTSIYVQALGLYRELRQRAFPEVSPWDPSRMHWAERNTTPCAIDPDLSYVRCRHVFANQQVRCHHALAEALLRAPSDRGSVHLSLHLQLDPLAAA